MVLVHVVFFNAQITKIRETNELPFKAITTEGNCTGVVNEAVYLKRSISGVGFEKYIGGSR